MQLTAAIPARSDMVHYFSSSYQRSGVTRWNPKCSSLGRVFEFILHYLNDYLAHVIILFNTNDILSITAEKHRNIVMDLRDLVKDQAQRTLMLT